MSARRNELAQGLAGVHARIAAACRAAGRPASDVTLVVVTKFFPARDVLELFDLGVRDFGENRDQEAGRKFAEVRERLGHRRGQDALTLHFVGQLQGNKAGRVAAYADVVHSIDRHSLVRALDRGAQAAGRRLEVLVQVSLDASTGRGGALPGAVDELAADVASRDLLSLSGVMAVAPLGADPDASFARLQAVAHGIRQAHPGARWISAGMSGDLEAAIRHGATHLRVGTAILGARPLLG